MFKKAKKNKLKLRLLLEGASGSGKTWSALLMASSFGKKVAVIDTEKGSASLYSDKFDFDVCELSPPYSPQKYNEAIDIAEKGGYDVIVIDSITHEWSGEGGCLDMQSKIPGNSYVAWGKVTPKHNAFLETILKSKCHIIATARTKADIVLEDKINKSGQMVKTPVKLGTKTEQRDGLDFEFTTVLRLSSKHTFEASKDRTGLFNDRDGEVLVKSHADELMKWLDDGEDTTNKEALISCNTEEALRGVWDKLTKDQHIELEDVKNEVKERINKSNIEVIKDDSKGFDFEVSK